MLVRAFWLAVLVSLAPRAFSAPTWEPFVEPYNQIFPSLEIATATLSTDPADQDPAVLGDQQGLIGIELSGAAAGSRYELLVRVPGLARDSRLSGTIPALDEPLNLAPTMVWDFPLLANLKQSRPATVEFELTLDGKPQGTRTQRVRVRSVNDALYFIDEEGEDNDLDFNWLFAAYVNEGHPAIQTILKEALDSGVVDTFSGYQDEDPNQVLKQVFAIWHALQQRGIRYSSIARTASEHQVVMSQYVRFIDESLSMTQANCVDGSVLLASVLRKIDIAPVLVLVPGHMFLGFALDAEGEDMAYLETTMLGEVKPQKMKRLSNLNAEGELSVDLEESLANFEAALARGQEQVDEAGDAFADEDDADHQMIDIRAAREYGVMPITR